MMHPANIWCFTREAVVAMRRRKLIAVATLSTCFIALLVLAATIVAALNLSAISSKLRSSAEVTVFLRKDVTEQQRTEFEAWLVHAPGAGAVDYVSPSEALEELASQLGHDARLIEAAGGNPIPPSFRVRAGSPEQVRALADTLRSRDETLRVVYASDATARLVSVSRLANIAGLFLSILLGAAAVTIIHNAMAVAIDARRRDIRIMRLVGADPRFIRLPYLISGALYGVFGALAASLVTVLGYGFAADTVREALPFVPTVPVSRVVTTALPLTVVFGAGFGVIGAELSLARHLSPHRSPGVAARQRRKIGLGIKVALAVMALVMILVGTAAARADAALTDQIADAKRLGEAIASGTRRLRTLDDRLRTGERRLARLEKEVRTLEVHIAHVNGTKERVSGRLADQLFAYYAASRVGQVEVLAVSNNLDEAVIASERLRFVLDAEKDDFDKARSTLDELGNSKARLERARAEAADLTEQLRRLRRQAAQRRARQKAVLNRLTNQIKDSLAVYGSSARDILVYGTDGFIFPVAGRHNFTNDWQAPRTGHLHQGTDVFARRGTPLLSVVGGTVRLGTNGLGGIVIHLDGNDGTRYYYAHLEGHAPGLASGDSVAPGQLVGYVGDSGNAKGTPPHLHFQVHPGGGAPTNPYPRLARADKLLFASSPKIARP